MTHLKRRAFLATAIAAPMLATPIRAFALTSGAAQALVEKVMGELLGAINSGARGDALYKRFKRTFDRYADINIIAQSALGPARKRASCNSPAA